MSFNNIIRMALTKCIEDRVCNGGLIMHLSKTTTIPCVTIVAFIRGNKDLKEGELIQIQKQLIKLGEETNELQQCNKNRLYRYAKCRQQIFR